MSTVLRVLGVLIGLLLLLPGLCSLVFIVSLMPIRLSGPEMQPLLAFCALWAGTFAVGWGGVRLIRRNLRRQP
jgi:hypothetical protein